jgi:hypothetical protein
MQFYEKLDFLMNITNTSNSVLGQKLKLDPSYISRLRRGQRNALKDENIIASMAEYFAHYCMADYQLKSISDALNISKAILNSSELQPLVVKWLINEKVNEIQAVGDFMDNITELNNNLKIPGNLAKTVKPKEDTQKIIPQDDISVFYGIEGKRQAAEFFLLEVMKIGTPQTLLLYSDEATDWMTTDRDFAIKWAQLMIGVLSKGNRIKIIHTISRELDEMLNAIQQWMPMYMTGLIEPYYYPKKRDGVFKQTMFISPGVSAVISSSVGNSIDYAANLLIRNSDAIRAYTEVFNQYLNQCKPLMRIFTSKNKNSYLETLLEFEKEKCNTIIKTESISLLTMPEKVSSEILSRIGIKNSSLSDYQEQRIKIFKNHLENNNLFYEIIPIFDLETINNGKIKVSFSDMMNNSTVYYTKEEYIQHLEHITFLLEIYENFHIKLVSGMSESNYLIYAKEDLGVITAKTSIPPVVLAVNEINLTAAFWDFLKHTLGEKAFQYPNNVEESKELKKYIQKIKTLKR